MDYKQIEIKRQKLNVLLNSYRKLKNEIKNIREFSEIMGPGYSKSTIQRYFHDMYKLKIINEKEYSEICEWLKENKKIGNSLGGIVSQEKYGYEKDEIGHFKGGKNNG